MWTLWTTWTTINYQLSIINYSSLLPENALDANRQQHETGDE